jgi:hypothetical protein
MKILDSLEKGAGVAEVIPPEHPTIPWGHYYTLSARPRLRLGTQRQYHSVHSIEPPRVPGGFGTGLLAIVAIRRSSLTYSPCVRQLFDVSKGLEYLHSLDIPHGNLKGVGGHSHISTWMKPLSIYPSVVRWYCTDPVVTGECCC